MPIANFVSGGRDDAAERRDSMSMGTSVLTVARPVSAIRALTGIDAHGLVAASTEDEGNGSPRGSVPAASSWTARTPVIAMSDVLGQLANDIASTLGHTSH